MRPASVAIVFSEERDQVLVIKRRDVPIWAFVAGGIEPGEEPEQAVTRELEEETGLKAEIVRKAAVYTPVGRLGSVAHVFECKQVSGTLRTSDETADVKFVPIREIPSPFFILHEIWLQEILEKGDQLIERPIHELTYWNLFVYFLKHPIQIIRFALCRMGLPINS